MNQPPIHVLEKLPSEQYSIVSLATVNVRQTGVFEIRNAFSGTGVYEKTSKRKGGMWIFVETFLDDTRDHYS
ncbi:MAG: hypothetical protein ACRDF4_05135, partial [Rhabdochlamydiaceae bacterium]